MLQLPAAVPLFHGDPALPVVCRRDDGFSLIELLVVCLVIGILCAIAIPAFISQQAKAQDARPRRWSAAPMTAAESIATEHDGSYQQVERRSAPRSRASVRVAPSANSRLPEHRHLDRKSYSVTVKAVDGDELTISRDEGGAHHAHLCEPGAEIGLLGRRIRKLVSASRSRPAGGPRRVLERPGRSPRPISGESTARRENGRPGAPVNRSLVAPRGQ